MPQGISDWHSTIRGEFIKTQPPTLLTDFLRWGGKGLAGFLRSTHKGMSLRGFASLPKEEQMERLGNIALAGFGGMVRRAKFPIPSFKSTEEAMAFGKGLTEPYAKQVASALRTSLRESQGMKNLPLTSENFAKRLEVGTRNQFLREALESYRSKLPWNTKTTDMSFYDELLKTKKANIEWMAPTDYMREITKGFDTSYEWMSQIKSKDLARKYAKAMKEGAKFPMGMLEGRGIPKGQPGGFAQEGFHRAWAALMRGEREIPVVTRGTRSVD